MQLVTFDSQHARQLEAWFSADLPQNRFIGYYADTVAWLRLVDGKQRFALAAIDGEDLIGFVDLELAPERRCSIAYGVAPQHRGRGCGPKLLAAAEDFARQHGASTIYCGVEADNTANRQMLQKCGYVETPETNNMFGYTKQL